VIWFCHASAMKYIAFLIVMLPATAWADPPEILAAEAHHDEQGYSFAVTVAHPDSGWEHYADAWEVVAPDSTVLGVRTLLHPHEAEQPFTRSLENVVIPHSVKHVFIRVHCLVDGWAADMFEVTL